VRQPLIADFEFSISIKKNLFEIILLDGKYYLSKLRFNIDYSRNGSGYVQKDMSLRNFIVYFVSFTG